MEQRTLFNPDLPPGFVPRPKLQLAEIERLIRKYRFVVPCPSRQTLIRMCEDGTFEGELTRSCWEVFEDSFFRYFGYDEAQQKMAA